MIRPSRSSGDRLAERMNSGTNPSDLAERTNSGTNPEDLAERANSGINPGDLAERVNSGTNPGDLAEGELVSLTEGSLAAIRERYSIPTEYRLHVLQSGLKGIISSSCAIKEMPELWLVEAGLSPASRDRMDLDDLRGMPKVSGNLLSSCCSASPGGRCFSIERSPEDLFQEANRCTD
ncbi:hypothetical protein BHM03_00030317 [Ensete ventricosum]|uniref:Uncharacterized protein n=1 Tax=Ensete ventricosum TaxID=4639 RepID=A0A445MID8_ENSVE|nr:hypothetical protein BHM03_00030317 [Ensete ventricosum]